MKDIFQILTKHSLICICYFLSVQDLRVSHCWL